MVIFYADSLSNLKSFDSYMLFDCIESKRLVLITLFIDFID